MPKGNSGANEVFASDAAKQKAENLGVDPADVEGSGSSGRIKVEDVEAVAQDEEKSLYQANPARGAYSVGPYEDGRVFYAEPNLNPEGPDAQRLSDAEYAKYATDVDGEPVIVKVGE